MNDNMTISDFTKPDEKPIETQPQRPAVPFVPHLWVSAEIWLLSKIEEHSAPHYQAQSVEPFA